LIGLVCTEISSQGRGLWIAGALLSEKENTWIYKEGIWSIRLKLIVAYLAGYIKKETIN
jgi:hypothetical protein